MAAGAAETAEAIPKNNGEGFGGGGGGGARAAAKSSGRGYYD